MRGREIEERFKELSSCDKFICTEDEFNDFQNYGYLIPLGKSYLTRLGQKIDVSIIKQVTHKFNINLSDIINKALIASKDSNYKRVYCMSKDTYNKYAEIGRIVEVNNKKYYRFFEGEMWLVMIL